MNNLGATDNKHTQMKRLQNWVTAVLVGSIQSSRSGIRMTTQSLTPKPKVLANSNKKDARCNNPRQVARAWRLVSTLATLLVTMALFLGAPIAHGQNTGRPLENFTGWQSGTMVQLRWDPGDPGDVETFNVYRRTNEGEDWTKVMTVPYPLANVIDNSPPRETVVFYRVTTLTSASVEVMPGAETIVELDLRAFEHAKAPKARLAAAEASATYDPDSIISDAQLTDTSTMSLTDIQNFLVAKGSVLANYSAPNGKTAAQIIFNASQAYTINPQIVITTLQKEQGLVGSSTSNLQPRLDWAMGYGARSSFEDQVINGTHAFRRYEDNLSGYFDVKGVPWAIGKERAVFDGTVTASSTATAGLFIYTPWIGQLGGGAANIGGNGYFWQLWNTVFGFGTFVASTAPAAPSGLSATALSSSSIRVAWTDNASNETGFTVWRWNGSAWVQIATVGSNVTSYTITGLAASTTYYFTVGAVNSVGSNFAADYATGKTL